MLTIIFNVIATLFLALALTFTIGTVLNVFVAIHYEQAFTLTIGQEFMLSLMWALFILFKFWL